MKRRVICMAVLAATLVAPQAFAQASAPVAASSVANPVDPAAVDALRRMGTYLQSLKRFSVSTELTGERVLEDGQKLQHTATADLDVDRPHRIRALMSSARSQRAAYFAMLLVHTPCAMHVEPRGSRADRCACANANALCECGNGRTMRYLQSY